jgi:peptide/nickel transport system substrate-binding protein
MHRRLWLVAGAAAAVLLLAASATAQTKVAATASVSKGTPAAAPFAQAWANVPRTTAGRKAANTVVVAIDEDVNCWNTILNACNELVGGYMGFNETTEGPFIENGQGLWVPTGITTSETATTKGLSYTINPKAYWYDGGKKVPVTYKDFVYTLQNFVNPKNDVASPTGYANLDPTHFTHKGNYQVTFFWKTKNCTTTYPCGPFANWKYIFSTLYPSFALKGLDFNKIWANCICDSAGKPLSDGPYYMTNYTKGQGVTLVANPTWVGKKAAVHEVDFKLILDDNAEVQALRGGEVDMITPNFGQDLAPLLNQSGITFSKIPGFYFEHLELREANRPGAASVTHGASNPLLQAPWMREAVAMGIDRQAIINTIYGPLAAGLKPLDGYLYYATQSQYKPDFAKWNYNPTKALALLKAHCTGGPTSPDPSNTKVWTCSGFPARFNWMTTTGQAPRATSEAIAKAQLKAIGIDINDASAPANVVFGNNGAIGGNYDIAEFAEITTGDPSDWSTFYACKGSGNYTGYCSHAVDKLVAAGGAELDQAKHDADFQAADKILAAGVPVIPMYQRPNPLIYKSSLLGVVNNPSTAGMVWNIQDWHWKS